MKLKFSILFVALTSLFILVWLGCSTAPTGTPLTNRPPETFLANVPPGQDTIPAVALVYWYGIDYDGFVSYYEWALSGDSVDPSNITTWDSIFATDDTMKLTIDDVDTSTIVLDTIIDTTIVSADTFVDTTIIWHFRGYFYVRAYDNEGLVDLTPAMRGWDVYSIKPVIDITAPDTSTGLLSHYSGIDQVFFPEGETAVVYVLGDTTSLWKGLQVWWNRKDTLNPTGYMPIGYRYRIDNNNWSVWTDENSATENDSFITFTGPLADGVHTFYLQGRNSSHIESDLDSFVFRAINPDIENGDIIVALASGLTWNFYHTWYEDLFTLIRPGAKVRVINKDVNVPTISLDSLKGVGLIIYVRDDMASTDPGFINDTLTLYKYALAGGKIFTFGLGFLNTLDTLAVGGNLMHEIFGVTYFNKCMENTFSGAAPSWQSSSYGFPSDTLMVDSTHSFPVNRPKLKFCENYLSSDPYMTVVYTWIGDVPWNETPVGVFYNNTETGAQSALFGFSPESMEWDSTTYEPIASVFDKVLEWYDL